MSNIIKYSETSATNSIQSGNFNVGVNNTSTNLTGFFNGISPIVGGYTIYVNKVSGGPSIYSPKNDSELVSIVNRLGANVETAANALVWINSQSNMTVLNNNYPSIVTSGLVQNWDSGFVSSYPKTGTTWKNLSVGGINSSLVNGVGYNSENFGSLVFDGVDDVITSSAGNNYPYPYHTFEIWVKSSGLAPGMTQGGLLGLDYGRVVTITSTGNIQYSLYTGVGANQGLLFIVSTTGVNVFDNNWHHIVCSRGESVYEMYVDGVLNKTGGNGGQSTWNGLNTWSSMTSVIGNNPNNSNLKLLGNISSVRIYNRQLTLQEVLQNYYAGLQRYIPTNGLVLSLDAQNTNLYATSPTTAYDISGNDNNGSLINGVQYVGDGDGSWKFDGVNDYVNVPNSSSLQVTDDQTLVFWVYPERRDRRQNFYNKAYGGEGTITYETNGSLNYYWGTNGGNGSPYQGVNSGAVMTSLNTWYFVVLVRELSTVTKTVKWFINGVLTNTNEASYTSATAGTSPITIGTGYAGSFLGKIGIVQQYNIALTQSEITTIYNATKSRYGL